MKFNSVFLFSWMYLEKSPREETSLEFNARASPEFLTDWVSELFSLSLPRPSICVCWRSSPVCRSVPEWIWFGFFASPRLSQSRFHLRWMRIQTRPLRSHNQTNSRCFLKLNMKYNIKTRSISIHMYKNRNALKRVYLQLGDEQLLCVTSFSLTVSGFCSALLTFGFGCK